MSGNYFQIAVIHIKNIIKMDDNDKCNFIIANNNNNSRDGYYKKSALK